ncbi:hypothetical protein MBLNU459_g2848t1 [Dothideomycetes sp. NU459]
MLLRNQRRARINIIIISPPDLLTTSDTATRQLSPYSTTVSTVRSLAFAIYPYYNLSDPSTTLVVTSPYELPIRLTNTLDLNYTQATYPWVNPLREEWLTPHSLVFAGDGARFVAGQTERIAIFDLTRSGEGPMSEIRTRKGRKARSYGESDISLAGLIFSMAINPADGILAAGTSQRQVGLWANEGGGAYISSFSLVDRTEPSLKGNGVSHMKWSPCGRYLFVAERQSDALLVYDIRVTGRRLAWLTGRKAFTTQKLGFDVAADSDGGLAVWAGGTDGRVRTWKNVTGREGHVDPDHAFKASDDAVSASLIYPGGSILATTSGQRRDAQDLLYLSDSTASDDSDNSDEEKDVESSSTLRGDGLDNKLKIWTL